MATFAPIIEKTLQYEGGYVNDPADPGGETNFGITLRTARRNGYSGDMRFLSIETARSIYAQEYWLHIQGERLPQPVAEVLFDMAVNSGPAQAIKILQRALGVLDDGILGPQTLSKIENVSPYHLAMDFLLKRHQFQASLPTWSAFSRGWSLRNLENARSLILALETPSGDKGT